VTALAFDGSPDIHLVTKGAVALADLGQPLNLGRRPCVVCHERLLVMSRLYQLGVSAAKSGSSVYLYLIIFS